jgi:glycine hydroxymethyltransferase
MSTLKNQDPEVYITIKNELERQRYYLELIASENIVSEAVLEAQGSIFTNKYKELFQAEYANVQAHSGSQANMAVYFAALNPGDKVLGMDLAHGGHLTHGSPVNFSGQLFNFISYGVEKKTGTINMEEVERVAHEHRPRMIVAGASAYPRLIDFEAFRLIADQIDALFMVDMAHIAGLVAAGVHPSPVPYADYVTTTTHKTMRGPRGGLILAKEEYGKSLNSKIFPGIQGGPLMHVIAAKAVSFKEAMSREFVLYQQQVVKNSRALGEALVRHGFRLVSGGSDNHLLLVDLTNKDITGKDAEETLESAGLTVNKNAFPFDTQSRFVTGGIRIGTPAVTSRGLIERDMEQIAEWMNRAILNRRDAQEIKKIRSEVRELCERFPLYPHLYADDV